MPNTKTIDLRSIAEALYDRAFLDGKAGTEDPKLRERAVTEALLNLERVETGRVPPPPKVIVGIRSRRTR